MMPKGVEHSEPLNADQWREDGEDSKDPKRG